MPADVGIRSGTAPKKRRKTSVQRGVAEALGGVTGGAKRTTRRVVKRRRPSKPSTTPYAQLKEAGELDVRGRQKALVRQKPRKPSERGVIVQQGGKVKVVKRKDLPRSYFVAKALRDYLNANPREKRLYRQFLAQRGEHRPAERGEADTRIAGINLDKITGAAGRGAIDVLEETTRPLHGIAGGTRAALRGENVAKAVAKGLSNEERVGFGEVLEELGVKNKTVRGVGGFISDVALDPTTYVTFGLGAGAKTAGSVAAKAARKAQAEATAKAVAEGASRKAARKAGSKAARKAFREAEHTRGITVGIAGKRTSGETSAKVLRAIGAPAAARQVSESGVGKAARRFFPVRPKEIDEATWARLSQAERERRAKLLHGQRRVARRARAVRKATGGTYRRLLPEREVAGGKLRVLPRRRKPAPVEASRRVRDAIEAGDLSGLSRAERMAAQEVIRVQEDLLQARRAAGEPAKRYAARESGEPKGYVTRQAMFALGERLPGKSAAAAEKRLAARVERKAEGRMMGRGRRMTTTEKDYERLVRAPMRQVREERPGLFLEDIEQTLKLKGRKDIERAANTAYRKEVQATGRPVKRGKPDYDVEREAVYDTSKGALTRLDRAEAARRAQTDPDSLVVLNKTVADHANRQLASQGRIPFIDNLTSKIKWVLTIPNPQYWSRNAYGGLFNAWAEGASAAGLAKAVPTAIRTSRRVAKRHKAEETLGAKLKPAARLPVGPGGRKVDADEFVDELERVNVEGGGLTQELIGAETRRRSKAQMFEDLPRFTAYIHYRRKGLSPNESAVRSLRGQFDYGDLTDLERSVARRIFPFYTWRSRNVALQAKTLVQRPGRLATVEKARENLTDIAGLPENWQDLLTEGEALGVPLPAPGFGKSVPVFGKGVPVVGQTSLLFAGLPVTDLNMLSLKQALPQLVGSVHPAIKSPVEFATNYNFFFRDQIEKEGSRWLPAPGALVDRLPKAMRDQAIEEGVLRKGKDRWTNRTVWQWRGKADYIAKLTPLTSTLLQQATVGLSRLGQSKGERGFGWLTGIRPIAVKPEESKLSHFERNRLLKLYEKRNELYMKQGDLQELRVHKRKGWDSRRHTGEPGWDTPEYKKVKQDIERNAVEIYKLEKRLGKRDISVPPRAKKKVRKSGPAWGSGLSGGGTPAWGSESKSGATPAWE